MITSLGNRTRSTDTDAVLRLLAPIVDRSGIAETLDAAAKPKSAAGAPPKYGQFTARGVLIAMFHAIYAGRPASVSELCALLWADYTDEQLAFIGLPDLRTPQRLATLTSNDRAWRNEHQRLWQYLQDLFEPIDDTARAANTRVSKTESKQAQERARITLADKTRLRRKVLNDLITQTIDSDLLGDWKGDLAIDEHVVHVAKHQTRYFDGRDGMAPATPMAKGYKKQNRVGSGWSVGLTRAVTTSRPDGRRVPNVCVALDINGSSAGSAPAALNCLDAFQVSPLRPERAAKDRTYLVTDQAYSRVSLFNADVLERGYSLLMNYGVKDKVLFDLSRSLDADASEQGPYLYQGTFLCPAARAALSGPIPSAPKPGDTKRHVERFNEHQKTVRDFEMPLNGVPTVGPRRGPGRPSKEENSTERVVKVRVQCPAAAGKVRCAIRATIAGDGSLTDTKKAHLPNISQSAPTDSWPVVCDSANTTVTLTPEQFRTYQPVMGSSWLHQDWMSCNRSRDEGFNSVLTATEGGNLQDRTLYARRNPALSLTIAFSVGRANLKIQEKWREVLRNNGGAAPYEPRAHVSRIGSRSSAA